jgi:hypothetical protein
VAPHIGGGFDAFDHSVTLALPGSSSGNQYNGRLITSGKQSASQLIFHALQRHTADSPGRSRPQGDLNIQPVNQVQSVSFIHTFSPTMVNEFRVNFTRFNFNQIATSKNVDFGIPRIEIEGFNFDRLRFGAPQASTTPAVFVENSYNFRDKIPKLPAIRSARGSISSLGTDNTLSVWPGHFTS